MFYSSEIKVFWDERSVRKEGREAKREVEEGQREGEGRNGFCED